MSAESGRAQRATKPSDVPEHHQQHRQPSALPFVFHSVHIHLTLCSAQFFTTSTHLLHLHLVRKSNPNDPHSTHTC